MEWSLVCDVAKQLAVIQSKIADRNPGRGPGIYDIPGVRLWSNPAEITPYPSSNLNRAELIPGISAWSEESASRVADWFSERKISPYFFWITACPDESAVEEALKMARFRQFGGAEYPVLARAAESAMQPATSLVIRPFDPGSEGDAIRQYPSAVERDRLFRSVDYPDEQCFVAWEGKTPVATGTVVIHDWLAYLYGGSTLETHRRRGAQSALIAARTAFAAEQGCRWVVSETVTAAKTSLANLERLGFAEIFRKKVFNGPTET